MAEPQLYFVPESPLAGHELELPEDTSRHIGQVLRMKAGENLQITNGKGILAAGKLVEVTKKRSRFLVEDVSIVETKMPMLELAIAFTKNASRNEWLLEKATEMGISRIIPLITERSFRERIKEERWKSIILAALLQSRQVWLPVLDKPKAFEEVVGESFSGTRLMAHCMDLERLCITKALKKDENIQIFIGPEGDFSPAELTLATKAGVIPISLGSNRLRTETAGLSAITYFYLINHA